MILRLLFPLGTDEENCGKYLNYYQCISNHGRDSLNTNISHCHNKTIISIILTCLRKILRKQLEMTLRLDWRDNYFPSDSEEISSISVLILSPAVVLSSIGNDSILILLPAATAALFEGDR